MKNKFYLILFTLFFFTYGVFSQSNTTAKTETEAKKAAGQGVTFKIPEKVMPMKDWKDFKGLLMLSAEGPSGLFISYPNENEEISDLKIRAEKFIARMFVHDDKKVDEIVWQIKSVPSHKGDKGDSAIMKTYEGDDQSIQITTYEREWNGLTFVYGYFARKSKTSKDKKNSTVFLDEKGNGAKVFDKFWKTFPNK